MKFSKKILQEYILEKLPENEALTSELSKKAFEIESIEEHTFSNGEKTSILDIKILPNRAHDCLGHFGIAREISAIFNLTLKDSAKYFWNNFDLDENYIFLKSKIKEQKEKGIEFPKAPEIFIENIKDCTSFASVKIENISVAESPIWLKNFLESIGQKSINNIVDITNFVQFILNKPMHAYDASYISGKLCVLYANDGEKFLTLDDKEIILDNKTLIIADSGIEGKEKSKVLGLAGIKGGKFSGINNFTKDLILESANFNPNLIRKTSQKFNIKTDASKRFENEISDNLIPLGLFMTAKLILEIAGNSETKISEIVNTYNQNYNFKSVKIKVSEVEKVLGREISEEKVLQNLQKLGFKFEKENEFINVIIPPERLDILIKIDIFEEIIRLEGFDSIESREIVLSKKGLVNKMYALESFIKNILINKGFSEIYGYTFTDSGEIEIALPLAKDKAFLRTDLISQAENFYYKNKNFAPLFEKEEIAFFEIGTVFNLQKEERRLVLVKDDSRKKSNFLPEIIETLQEIYKIFGIESLNIIHQKEKPAIVEVSLSDLFEILEKKDISILENLQQNFQKIDYEMKQDKYIPFSVYPFISRDISLWVNSDFDFENLKENIINLNLENLLKVYKFDEFIKKDENNIERKSIAFRIIFQSFEKTLTDEEVEIEMQKLNNFLAENNLQSR